MSQRVLIGNVKGPAGPGAPSGGSNGYYLRKASSADYDFEWAAGTGDVTIDSALSSSSTNPVQNKIIKSALDGKQAALTFDNEPTSGSNNPVKSSGVKTAIDNAVSNDRPFFVRFTIAIDDWEASGTNYVATNTSALSEKTGNFQIISAYPATAPSGGKITSGILVSISGKTITFTTKTLPYGATNSDIAVRLVLQKVASVESNTGSFFLNKSGGSGAIAGDSQFLLASGLSGATARINAINGIGNNIVLGGLDASFTSGVISTVATMPDGYKPLFPVTGYGYVVNGGTRTDGVAFNLGMDGIVSINSATCDRVSFTAMYDNRTMAVGTFDYTIRSGSTTPTITVSTNQITKDTVSNELKLQFAMTVDEGTMDITRLTLTFPPEFCRATNGTVAISMSYVDGSGQTGEVPNVTLTSNRETGVYTITNNYAFAPSVKSIEINQSVSLY